MKKNFSDYLVALVVIACSLVLLGALTFALSGWRSGKPVRTLYIYFPDVTGIRIHSEVRYAGAPAGTVTSLRLLTFAERAAGRTPLEKRNAVRVTLALHEGVPPLPDDVRASLSSDTMLSEKFVALTAGSPDAPKLADGSVLQGLDSGSLDTLISSAAPLLEALASLIRTTETAVRGLDPVLTSTGEAIETFRSGISDALPRVSKLADGLKETSDAAEQTLKRIDKLVADVDEPVKADLKALRSSLVKLEQVLGTTDQLVRRTDRNLDGRMSELGVVLQNLKVVSTHAKALTQTLGERPNRLIFGGKPQKLTPEQEILRSTKPLPAVKP